jgi:signal transduction histidine kinase
MISRMAIPQNQSSAPVAHHKHGQPVEQLFRFRIDRLIVTARALLAAFGLVAIWLDPSQPAYHATATYTVLAVYASFSIALAALYWHGNVRAHWGGTIAQFADPAIIAVLVYLTEGPTSPFFIFFSFAVLGAMLKWQWKGALYMSLVVITLNVVTGVLFYSTAGFAEVDVQRLIIRTAWLTVGGSMLVFFGLHQARIGQAALRVAVWPETGSEDEVPIKQALIYASEVFSAPRTLFVWSDQLEPWLNVTEQRGSEFGHQTLAPGMYEPIVASVLTDKVFLFERKRGTVRCYVEGGPIAPTVEPINAALAERYEINSALCLPIRAESAEGWIFILDNGSISLEDLPVGSAVAVHIGMRMARASVAATERRAVAAEDRLALARDLHDSVLQALVGAALQMQGLAESIGTERKEIRERIRAIQESLTLEQREVRHVIGRLREPESVPGRDLDLCFLLLESARRLERQWGVSVQTRADPAGVRISAITERDVSRIMSPLPMPCVTGRRVAWRWPQRFGMDASPFK